MLVHESKQPWFIMNAAEDYRLIVSQDPCISHFYSFTAGQSSELTLAIPDGCIDIIFDCDDVNPSAKICGTTLAPVNPSFKADHRYFGVRFELGLIPKFLNISADLLVNQQIDLLDLVPSASEVFERIAGHSSHIDQAVLLSQFLRKQPTHQPSPLTSHAVELICNSNGNIRAKELEHRTGFTRRTLFRRFINDIGVSPKVFSRIIRCQLAINDIDHQNEVTLSSLAQNLGFTDQAHFQHEFKKMVSVTPNEYRSRVNRDSYLDRIRYS